MIDPEKSESEKPEPEKPGNARNNASIFAYVSFFVAALSLVTSMYQGYLNTRFVELIQSGVARAETARICKDLIDAFFQIKFRTEGLVAALEREKNPNSPGVVSASADARSAVSRFGAYGTYLANFQGEKKRYEYTMLSRELARIVESAHKLPAAEPSALFGKADEMFGVMNADCVRSATAG